MVKILCQDSFFYSVLSFRMCHGIEKALPCKCKAALFVECIYLE